ncbi:MAG: ArsR/SmtB family transcription factor [Acetobacteraceae bacterium]
MNGNAEPVVLSGIFSALSDLTRQQIVARLAHGPCTVSELSQGFAVTAPAISKHLNVLDQTGLITRWKKGRVHYCQLRDEPLRLASDWIEQQRSFWEQRFRQLDRMLQEDAGPWDVPPSQEPNSPSGSVTDSPPSRTKSSRPGQIRKR